MSEIVLNDKRNLYNQIKDVETTNVLILEFRENLKKEIGL